MESWAEIRIKGERIQYFLSEHAIHIINDAPLVRTILKHDGAMDIAVQTKKKFHSQYGREIAISDYSVALEIYGHVFPDKMASFLKQYPLPEFLQAPLDFILKHTDIIDIGESEKDIDRKIWDTLAPLYKFVHAE
ncbi:hypothetical protein [Bacillus sp. 1P06AnD]|uniref:hypothetical protein n=1 Tax=Bacillus sp. 1P06AnD TaxID=3132208 RepID=UPI0039A31BC2